MCCDSGTNNNDIDVKCVLLFPNILTCICKTSVACRATVNAQDRNKNTPLHIIAKCTVADIDILRENITSLIENGAHLDTCNKDGKTAVDVASTCIAEVIIKAQMKQSLTCLAARAVTWARSCENVSYAICEQQRCRSACASAQSDQHLCCSLLR